MRLMCSRPDCAERGVARALIEPRERRIILDRRIDDAGAAILCAAHADRVTVPQGWTLDDRREDNPRLFGVGRFNEPKQTRDRFRRLPESIAAAMTQLPLVEATPYDLPPDYEHSGASAPQPNGYDTWRSDTSRSDTSRSDTSRSDTSRSDTGPTDPGPRPNHISATDQALARARARALDGTNNALFGDVEANASLLTRAFSAARSRRGSHSGLAALIPPGDEPGRPSAGTSG